MIALIKFVIEGLLSDGSFGDVGYFQQMLLTEIPVNEEMGEYEFSRIFTFENWSPKGATIVPLEGNEDKVVTGYSNRPNENDLSMLERWIPASEAPKATYLRVICYSKEQLAKEGIEIDKDWGVVHVQATMSVDEQCPPPPCTMVRNSMGIEHGGNGTPLDIDRYQESVKFWTENVSVR